VVALSLLPGRVAVQVAAGGRFAAGRGVSEHGEGGPTGTVSYTYNGDGTTKTMTVAGQPTVSYGYDAYGRRTSVGGGAGRGVTLSYDDLDRLLTTVLPGGVVRTYTYDAA
jgi:YD repeat-containing protein